MDDTEEDKTLWVGNLADKVTEEILYELFLQAGPLEKVKIPLDRDGNRRSYGFITFKHKESVPYTINLFSGIALYKRELRLQVRPGSCHNGVQSRSDQFSSPPHSASPMSSPDHGPNHRPRYPQVTRRPSDYDIELQRQQMLLHQQAMMFQAQFRQPQYYQPYR